MNFLNQCNGIDLQGRAIPKDKVPEIQAAFERVSGDFRRYVEGPGYDRMNEANHNLKLMIGSRHTVNHVLNRLQGWDPFETHANYGSIDEWVLDAMRDCARSDYWYSFEKEW